MFYINNGHFFRMIKWVRADIGPLRTHAVQARLEAIIGPDHAGNRAQRRLKSVRNSY